VIAEYRESKGYQQDVLKELRPQLEQTLAQVHDYKQFVQQIVQNVVVLLESEFPGLPLEEKLEKARREEGAIYWAAVVMDEKLDAALFLESPQRIYEQREWSRFRLHGMVVKYIKIYQSRADRKKVSVVVSGESWGVVKGNARAMGIIPHTLIDNALKYAPERSRVNVDFHEDKHLIELIVSSKGPRIRSDERERIFDLFYRGASAKRMYKEGTGFGLASAQNIARAHETKIEVEQSKESDENGDHETVFRVRFEKVGVVGPVQ
jgi:signal transduction histidine kinase